MQWVGWTIVPMLVYACFGCTTQGRAFEESSSRRSDASDPDVSELDLEDAAEIVGSSDSSSSGAADTTHHVEDDSVEQASDCVPLEYRVVDKLIPFDHMDRFDYGVQAVGSASAFRSTYGLEAPATIDFDREWALVITGGLWHVEGFTLDSLASCHGVPKPELINHRSPKCSPLVESQTWGDVSIAAVRREPDTDFNEINGFTHIETLDDLCGDAAPGKGEPCSRTALCQSGLVCAGLTHSTLGRCVSVENRRSFSNWVAHEIPDGQPAGIEIDNPVVFGNGVQAADVVVAADIAHPSPRQLHIELESPTGRRVVVWDHEADEISVDRAADGYAGEPVDGAWVLHVADVSGGDIGQVTSWTLTIVGEP